MSAPDSRPTLQQLAICADIPDEVFVKLAQVSEISQRWYLSRLDRGAN